MRAPDKKRLKLMEIHPLFHQIRQIKNPDFLDQIHEVANQRRAELDLEEKRAWIDKALQSPHEVEQMCAKAMAHFLFGELPEERTAYKIADMARAIEKWRWEHEGSIPGWVNITDYVFRYTHYDNCDNGHFFRRS